MKHAMVVLSALALVACGQLLERSIPNANALPEAGTCECADLETRVAALESALVVTAETTSIVSPSGQTMISVGDNQGPALGFFGHTVNPQMGVSLSSQTRFEDLAWSLAGNGLITVDP